MQSPQYFWQWFIVTLIDNICTAISLSICINLLTCIHFSFLSDSSYSPHHDVILGSGFIYLLTPLAILSTPIFGRLSDIWGRKKVLLIILYISFISYFALIFANFLQNIFLALLGAILLGLGSSMAITQAVIADISSGRQKAYYFALVAFILSPIFLFVTVTTDAILASSYHAYLYSNILITASGFISLTNIIVARKYLKEPVNFIIKNKSHTELYITLLKLVKNKLFLLLIALLILFQFGTGLFLQSASHFYFQNFVIQQALYNWFIYYKVALMAISLLVLYPIVLRWFQLKTLLILCLILCFFSIAGINLNLNLYYLWFFESVLCVGQCIAIAIIWTLISDAIPREDQGIVMGIKGSFWVLAWTLSAILAKYINHQYHVSLSLHISEIILFASLILSLCITNANARLLNTTSDFLRS